MSTSTDFFDEIQSVCRIFENTYGRPRLGNPREPVDDLVYIILSNRTSPNVTNRVYENLKSTCPTWEDVARSPVNDLATVLYPAGLSKKKAAQIINSLKKIKVDFGSITLEPLRKMTELEVEAYLVSLDGVSKKVAKCVMLFALDMEVLPVDSHVHRVSRRLGWTDKADPVRASEDLESQIPPHLRYIFHVGCISHGRRLCRPKNPNCSVCLINVYCRNYDAFQKTLEA